MGLVGCDGPPQRQPSRARPVVARRGRLAPGPRIRPRGQELRRRRLRPSRRQDAAGLARRRHRDRGDRDRRGLPDHLVLSPPGQSAQARTVDLRGPDHRRGAPRPCRHLRRQRCPARDGDHGSSHRRRRHRLLQLPTQLPRSRRHPSRRRQPLCRTAGVGERAHLDRRAHRCGGRHRARPGPLPPAVVLGCGHHSGPRRRLRRRRHRRGQGR